MNENENILAQESSALKHLSIHLLPPRFLILTFSLPSLSLSLSLAFPLSLSPSLSLCPVSAWRQREKLVHQLEEERRLRLDSERRLREVTEESELGRTQMTSLQQHFSR